MWSCTKYMFCSRVEWTSCKISQATYIYINDNPTSFVSVVSIYLNFLSDLLNIITITAVRDTGLGNMLYIIIQVIRIAVYI